MADTPTAAAPSAPPKATRKRTAPATPKKEHYARTVHGEIVCHPVTGIPLRRDSLYRPEYCDQIIAMFERMLKVNEQKLLEMEQTDERTKKAKPERSTDSANRKKHLARLAIVDQRTTKQRRWKWIMAELPSMLAFGREIGVSSDVLQAWRDRYPTFDEACKRCQDMGQAALAHRALNGQYDAEFAKFVGKNWYAMKDRQEITGADGAPLNPPPQLRAIPIEVIDQTLTALYEGRRKLLEAATAPEVQEG